MSLRNPWSEFLGLLPARPLQVGTVSARNGDLATVALPGGGVVQARGSASFGQRVFVRDGVIEGEAPALAYIEAEV